MNNAEPNLENIFEAMQAVHDALLQTTLRSEHKADARNKMAWAIESESWHGRLVGAQLGVIIQLPPTSRRGIIYVRITGISTKLEAANPLSSINVIS
jgi:hypothetical protein